ncbi:hypothetical protein [Actinoplanes couchii]|uniref:hypothetical protein n=1 Tax=Actinoplanes couchii TaxID=403638 RepID=UPI001940AB3A|nr:hypothetical protein [Actinoplanes couchii]MDR6319612.1 hypothetical protein [Actinoplanes couchii]
MDTPELMHLRLFAESSVDRSADLAAALVRSLAGYGAVHVRESGVYWKIPAYLEFNADLTSLPAAVDQLKALEPSGWSGDVWNHRPDGPPFLVPEIRWAWLTHTTV